MLLAIVNFLAIFAQDVATPGNISSGLLGGMLGATGSVGYVIYQSWYNTTVAQPRDAERHEQERQKLVAAIKDEREIFLTELRAERAQREQQAKEFLAAINGIDRTIRDSQDGGMSGRARP